MKPSLPDVLLVALGSAAGGVVRYLLAARIAPRALPYLPWGTFVVNVSGCFLIGLLYAMLAGRHAEHAWPGWRPLLGVGFLGGYTTFSTLMYDTWRLGWERGVLLLVGSAVAGGAAVVLGARLARLF